jgi:undecaprenyl-diphosphatase
MLSHFQAAVLGVLQGVSELFPISSLGHSVILPGLLGWPIDQNADSFLTFVVATHFATALTLFVVYRDDWVRIIGGVLGLISARKFLPMNPDAKLGLLLIVGTVPAGAVGFIFQRQVQKLFISPMAAALFLMLNGGLLYLAERLRKRQCERGPQPHRFADCRPNVVVAVREGRNSAGSCAAARIFENRIDDCRWPFDRFLS